MFIMLPFFSNTRQCIEQLARIGATKEDVFRVPGNHGKIKKLLSALETAQEFKVAEMVNPHTLNGFIKRTLKEQHLGPLMSRSTQMLLAGALQEAKDDPDAQVCGTLCTQVISRFGKTEAAHSTSACISHFLHACPQKLILRNALELVKDEDLAVLRDLSSMFAKFLERSAMTKATAPDIARSYGEEGPLALPVGTQRRRGSGRRHFAAAANLQAREALQAGSLSCPYIEAHHAPGHPPLELLCCSPFSFFHHRSKYVWSNAGRSRKIECRGHDRQLRGAIFHRIDSFSRVRMPIYAVRCVLKYK